MKDVAIQIKELNKKIKICNKCRLSETRINIVCGQGELHPRFMLIAQAPGENEDKKGQMFIGPSGKILDELLETAKINRKNVYMTNLVKCMLPKCRKPKLDEIDSCKEYLDREIELINPEFLIPLGYYAIRYTFEKYSVYIPEKSEFPQVFGKLVWSGIKKILPLKHPASILYNKEYRERMTKNYKKLKILSQDCKWYNVCPMKTFYEKGLLNRKWIELYCKGYWKECVRYQMEEKGEFHPDYMLADGSIDENLRM
jgi:DNA polymerase